ncbi:hypothetical protein [Cupriavidus sp. TMH.W2]|uniref:hypothetical protein n=1 Tax=Cupriavidus sp. TMH.W2 TaxID=3434465 RepID=UPI003D771CD9
MTIYAQLFDKLRAEAVSLGIGAVRLGADGRAVMEALEAWGRQAGRAGASGYAEVCAALVNLRPKDSVMAKVIRQLDKRAMALHKKLYGKA